MTAKQVGRPKQFDAALLVHLRSEDKTIVEALAEAMDCSQGEAVRRLIRSVSGTLDELEAMKRQPNGDVAVERYDGVIESMNGVRTTLNRGLSNLNQIAHGVNFDNEIDEVRLDKFEEDFQEIGEHVEEGLKLLRDVAVEVRKDAPWRRSRSRRAREIITP